MIKHIKNLIQTYKEDQKLNKLHDYYESVHDAEKYDCTGLVFRQYKLEGGGFGLEIIENKEEVRSDKMGR